jgi:hypothetical protein
VEHGASVLDADPKRARRLIVGRWRKRDLCPRAVVADPDELLVDVTVRLLMQRDPQLDAVTIDFDARFETDVDAIAPEDVSRDGQGCTRRRRFAGGDKQADRDVSHPLVDTAQSAGFQAGASNIVLDPLELPLA